MPSCFQLTEKESGKVLTLNRIDEMFCQEVLNVKAHEKYYGAAIFDWFNTIGFCLAVSNFDLGTAEFRKQLFDFCGEIKDLADYLEWFEKKFTSNSFYERKQC